MYNYGGGDFVLALRKGLLSKHAELIRLAIRRQWRADASLRRRWRGHR